MGKLTFLGLIKDQWWKVAPVEHADLTGKTVVVIGANVGLGFEAAKHFASMNPKRLVLGCRSQEKGQAAIQGEQATRTDAFRHRAAFVSLLTTLLWPQPYKPPGLRMPSLHSSTSLDSHPFRHLRILSFAIMLK
jgi:hypothetical protein